LHETETRLEAVEGKRSAELNERLALARAMLGTFDPLDFFADWRTPEERYRSKYGEE
jgi:hypothetical protein